VYDLRRVETCLAKARGDEALMAPSTWLFAALGWFVSGLLLGGFVATAICLQVFIHPRWVAGWLRAQARASDDPDVAAIYRGTARVLDGKS